MFTGFARREIRPTAWLRTNPTCYLDSPFLSVARTASAVRDPFAQGPAIILSVSRQRNNDFGRTLLALSVNLLAEDVVRLEF